MAGTPFTTGVMRAIQGDLFKPRLTDAQGNPRTIKNGPNAGQPSPQWFVAAAVPKNAIDPANAAFLQLLQAEAFKHWPNLFPQGAQGPCSIPTFSNKLTDGDGFDTSGKKWSDREGFAGNWVVKLSSGFAPKVYPAGRYSPADIITDPTLARLGYYYRFAGTIDTNANPQKPGLYVNITMAELVGYGVEIIPGPDASAAFGASAAALPVGASATPLAPSGGMPAAPQAPAPAAPAAAPGAPGTFASAPAPTTSPSNTYSPSTSYMTPPPAPSAPAAPTRTMTPAANGVTYEQYKAASWSDEQLIAQGLMVMQ